MEKQECEIKKAPMEEVVVINKAFDLASSWVQHMSGGADFDAEEEIRGLPTDEDANPRPMRLGLGAKYLPHSQARGLNQVEYKLRAKLNASRTVPSMKGVRKSEREALNDEQDEKILEEDEEEGDSRASAFKKRPIASTRPALIVSQPTGSKKKKRRGP